MWVCLRADHGSNLDADPQWEVSTRTMAEIGGGWLGHSEASRKSAEGFCDDQSSQYSDFTRAQLMTRYPS